MRCRAGPRADQHRPLGVIVTLLGLAALVTVGAQDAAAVARATSPGLATPGFGLNLTVWTNPLENGSQLRITPYVSGANGSLSYHWTGLPPGCGPDTLPRIDCAPWIGVYNITLEVTDAGGDSANASVTLAVIAALGAGLAWIGLGGCANWSAGVYTVYPGGGDAPYTIDWHLVNGTVVSTSMTRETWAFPNGTPVLGYVTVEDALGAQVVVDAGLPANDCAPPPPIPMPPPSPGLPARMPDVPPVISPTGAVEWGVVLVLLFGAGTVEVVAVRDWDRRRRSR